MSNVTRRAVMARRSKAISAHQTLNSEIRRLQRTLAVLIACQVAAADEADFEVGDALEIPVALLGEALGGLGDVELALVGEVSHGN